MSFIRKIKKGDKTYLAEVENRRVEGKVVQRFIRYVGKQADGRTVLSTSLSDVEVAKVWTIKVSTAWRDGLHEPILICSWVCRI
jgi:hypothetical protein